MRLEPLPQGTCKSKSGSGRAGESIGLCAQRSFRAFARTGPAPPRRRNACNTVHAAAARCERALVVGCSARGLEASEHPSASRAVAAMAQWPQIAEPESASLHSRRVAQTPVKGCAYPALRDAPQGGASRHPVARGIRLMAEFLPHMDLGRNTPHCGAFSSPPPRHRNPPQCCLEGEVGHCQRHCIAQPSVGKHGQHDVRDDIPTVACADNEQHRRTSDSGHFRTEICSFDQLLAAC